ncbi:MAG TPA: hypothetical protein VII13_01635, partial [Vicinamibacteria bacterium]
RAGPRSLEGPPPFRERTESRHTVLPSNGASGGGAPAPVAGGDVFLVSLARFARHAEWSWPAGRGRMGALNALLAVLLLLHLQTGLWYYARGVRHGDW